MPSPDDLRAFRAAILLWVQNAAPELLPDDLHVTVHSASRRVVIARRLIPREATRDDQGLPEPGPPAEGELTPCERDVLAVLERAGKRLTTQEVLQALARWAQEEPEHLHGDSTVTRALAELCRRKGLLSNRRDTYGRGYGLADWS